MGYALAISNCYGCSKTFGYNPLLVPSKRINGVRQPFCLECINRANVQRARKGLEPIVPLIGAYEPIDETELPL